MVNRKNDLALGAVNRSKHQPHFLDKNVNLLDYELGLYHHLYESRTPRVFNLRICDALENIGISHWGYLRLDAPLEVGVNQLIGIRDTAFSDTYISECLHECDLLMQHAQAGSTPLCRSALRPLLFGVNASGDIMERNRAVFELSERLGYHDCLVIPIVSTVDATRIVFSACTKNMPEKEFLRRVNDNIEKLRVIAKVVDEVGCRKFPEIFFTPQLEREKQMESKGLKVLDLMVRYDIPCHYAAEKLHISKRTAEQSISLLKKELGVETIAAGVYKAQNLKLIR